MLILSLVIHSPVEAFCCDGRVFTQGSSFSTFCIFLARVDRDASAKRGQVPVH